MNVMPPLTHATSPASKPSWSGGYVAGIDGLRALAVLSVLAYHTREVLLPGGFVGVDVFFVISGFVVTASVSHWPLDSLFGFQLRFYARRIIRIIPALLVCLLVTALVHSLVVPAVWLSNLAPKTANAAFFGFSNMVLAFNRDNYFSPTAVFNPFVHTWSLGVEEQFYLVFPFAFVLARRVLQRPALTFAALSLGSLATAAILQATELDYAFY